jgi:8-oxo-dGTP diphosphatase
MSFRISVESVVCRNRDLDQTTKDAREVLLVKRAPDCKVAPGVWNVPAGKVALLETTTEAVVRETEEETKLKVNVVKLLAENAFEVQSGNEKAFRNMFTYLTEPTKDSSNVHLNHEHTEYKWVTEKEMQSEQYASLMPRLKDLIIKGLNDDAS